MRYIELYEEADVQILRHCKYYIKQNPDYKIKPLYRGISNLEQWVPSQFRDGPPSIVKLNNMRTKPTHTNKLNHDIFNYIFTEMGFSNIRSHALFCSGDRSEAARYGTVYAVYPIGKFKFYWNPTIPADFMNIVPNEDTDDVMPSLWNEPKKIDPYGNTLNDIYIAYDEGHLDFEEIKDKVNWNKVKELLAGYQTTNLPEAIRCGAEVMIDCKQYYVERA